MLRSITELHGYTVAAVDGTIGQVYEFYFDDEAWVIRYLVVETGAWLSGRRILISPGALSRPDWKQQIFPVNLNRAEVKQSPDIDVDQPVSRRQEIALHEHFQWPYYWTAGQGPVLGSAVNVYRSSVAGEGEADPGELLPEQESDHENGDPYLRRTREVTGYRIQARDGEIGHVQDFIVDDETWAINYLVVDTRNWLPGRKVLVSPNWIEAVNWAETKVHIDLARETIANSPEYDPTGLVNETYEDPAIPNLN
jgi:sporulation protein YlmC with PRC-barrel domain